MLSFALITLATALASVGVSFSMNRRYRLAAAELGAAYLLKSLVLRAAFVAAFFWLASRLLA